MFKKFFHKNSIKIDRETVVYFLAALYPERSSEFRRMTNAELEDIFSIALNVMLECMD